MQFSLINFRSHRGIEFTASGQLGKSDVEIIDETLATARANGDWLSDVVRIDVCINGNVKHEYIVQGGVRTTHYSRQLDGRRLKMRDSREPRDLFGPDRPVMRGTAALVLESGDHDLGLRVATISLSRKVVSLVASPGDDKAWRAHLRKDGHYWVGKVRVAFNV